MQCSAVQCSAICGYYLHDGEPLPALLLLGLDGPLEGAVLDLHLLLVLPQLVDLHLQLVYPVLVAHLPEKGGQKVY